MAKMTGCSHLRIRDGNAYGLNVEQFIASVEKQFNIDFRSLEQWKELVQRLHVMTTDCKIKIQDANYRKSLIIEKLYTQFNRPSPFFLTSQLARTAHRWQRMEFDLKKRKIHVKQEPEVIPPVCDELVGEMSDTKLTAHPNTEIVPSDENIEIPSKIDLDAETKLSLTPHLPPNVCVNPHKQLSPLESHGSRLSFQSLNNEFDIKTESEQAEWLLLKQTSTVISIPQKVIVAHDTLDEQTITFLVKNTSMEYMYIRFKSITNKLPFRRAKVLPATPMKLYPGLAVTYKIIFRLMSDEENFESSLYFKVGQKMLAQAPAEAFCVPVVSNFKAKRSVSVSEEVVIPPIYLWHMIGESGYSMAYVYISVDDKYHYHLHISKRLIDLSKESDSLVSLAAVGPNTESVVDRVEDDEIQSSKPWSESKEYTSETETAKTVDVIRLVVDDIVDLALETFLFENNYLFLQPHSKQRMPVYFTKAERIGCHQYYYDFEFIDPETDRVIITKTIKVFAEILPNPIQIKPELLDMSNSPITHGFCEDCFFITNTHKFCPVTVNIKLSTKMKLLLHVKPLETLVPPQATVPFEVKFCSRDFNKHRSSDDFVHFTFKITVNGNQMIYRNVPPFFYEIIAPCAFEFKKVYSKKYFSRLSNEIQFGDDSNNDGKPV